MDKHVQVYISSCHFQTVELLPHESVDPVSDLLHDLATLLADNHLAVVGLLLVAALIQVLPRVCAYSN